MVSGSPVKTLLPVYMKARNRVLSRYGSGNLGVADDYSNLLETADGHAKNEWGVFYGRSPNLIDPRIGPESRNHRNQHNCLSTVVS